MKKYRKPVPAKPPTIATHRFLDTRHLTPEMAAFFWSIVGLLIGILVFGGLYAIWSAIAADRAADVKDTPLQTATVLVETKNMWYGQHQMIAGKVRVRFGFRIKGHLVSKTEYDDDRSARTKVGDHVEVHYRVGKSGDIYLEDWQRLPF